MLIFNYVKQCKIIYECIRDNYVYSFCYEMKIFKTIYNMCFKTNPIRVCPKMFASYIDKIKCEDAITIYNVSVDEDHQ